jgi:hypothetical protein
MDASDKMYTTQEDIGMDELAGLHEAATAYNPKDDPDRSKLVQLRHSINRVANTQDRQFLLDALDTSVTGKPKGIHSDMIKAESSRLLGTDFLEGRITNPQHRMAISLLTADAYKALWQYPEDGEKIFRDYAARAELITKGATIEQVRENYRWKMPSAGQGEFTRVDGSPVKYEELASGERYIAIDGTVRTKR